MRRTFTTFVALLLLTRMASAQLVDNTLNVELRRIFPEIASGYIDLNTNGRADRNEDFDEYIADTAVKDGQLQAREVLAFIIRNYAHIPVETLRRVQTVLQTPQGSFAELIALEFRDRVAEAVTQKMELDSRGLFLTPTARREALERVSGYLAVLVSAYGREARSLEPEFEKARDDLFSMIERGYPLPDDLGSDNTAVLQNIMINTVLRERGSNPSRVRAAVKTLGRLPSAGAVGYLTSLMEDADLKSAAVAALGEIGGPEALGVLTTQLQQETNDAARVELIRAVGRVADRSSVALLQGILRSDTDRPPELTLAVMEALVSIVQSGGADPALLDTFQSYASSPVQGLRVLAIRGLASYPQNPRVPDLLFPLLTEKQPEEVTIAVIRSVNALVTPRTVPALMALLRSTEVTDRVHEEAILALGANTGGMQALAAIVQALESSSDRVGKAAQEALIVLYVKQPEQIVAAVGRTLARATDPAAAVRGAEVLSRLADPVSLPFLAPLLQSPHPEVKENATWALYRIRSGANPRVMEDLKTLVKSESETLQVRINAVRALGAIRVDTPQLKVWEVLVTATRMTGEKYAMLRYHAVRALGELGQARDEVIETLVRIATRDTNPDLVRAAVGSLQALASTAPSVSEGLRRAYLRTEDVETRLSVVEAMSDLGAPGLEELALPLLGDTATVDRKRRVVAALAQVGGEVAVGMILDTAGDARMAPYVTAVLGDSDPSTLSSILASRAKTETDPGISAVVQELLAQLDESF